MHLPSVRMQASYERLLKWAIYPTVAFILFSFVSLALTVHYWILGDWIVPRDITVTTKDFNQRTGRYETDDTIVYFTDRDTDVTISSGILCFSAAIIALVAWSALRKPNMDSQFAAVSKINSRLSSLYTYHVVGEASIYGIGRDRHDGSWSEHCPSILNPSLYRKR